MKRRTPGCPGVLRQSGSFQRRGRESSRVFSQLVALFIIAFYHVTRRQLAFFLKIIPVNAGSSAVTTNRLLVSTNLPQEFEGM